jgi:pseudouridine-5'-phosphate glycosidase
VAAALAASAPIVALETTVVKHGLPHPDGVETATLLEQVIRDTGAVPATIGVLAGRIRVGLTHRELEQLVRAPGAAKINLSNLAAALTSRQSGSTTVAATMFAAHASGIRIFATGGIGGVHRNVAETGDVSSDLTALARIPVAVISAGAKAVLDLPRTVEMLETLGVPVFGFGTEEFPAFYRRSSGLRLDHRFDSIDDLAHAVESHFSLGLGTGVLVANPIPAADEMSSELYERAIETALSDAQQRGIRGRALTPFLLDRMRELTGGESVRVNVALLRHNASVAAALAVALSRAGP